MIRKRLYVYCVTLVLLLTLLTVRYNQHENSTVLMQYENWKTMLSDMQIRKPIPQERQSNNVYKWDDRDPVSWLKLPLESALFQHSKQRKAQTPMAVFYNRIHKTGSRYLITVVRKLAKRNNFNVISSTVYRQDVIDWHQKQDIAQMLDWVQKPYFYERHVHYFNLSTAGMRTRPLPVFINIIRDPLSRMVSHYNFIRFGDGTEGHIIKSDNLTIDDCILQNDPECSTEGNFEMIPYFCGQTEQCRQPTLWAMQQAMYNVEHHFYFVGVVEELENSIRLLEILLPSFFQGAVNLMKYNQEVDWRYRETASKYKYRPSEVAEAIMLNRLHLEYHFYQFVLLRFKRLKAKYNI